MAQPVDLPDWRHDHRYGLYTVREGTLVLLACADTPAGVGTAIVTLGDDAHEAGVQPDCVGVLDGRERRWLAHPRWS